MHAHKTITRLRFRSLFFPMLFFPFCLIGFVSHTLRMQNPPLFCADASQRSFYICYLSFLHNRQKL